MRGRILGVFAALGAACLAVLVLGPVAAGQVESTIQPVRPLPQPYTAEFKTTRVQTLANGTTITRESTRVQAVDSQGRTLSANTSAPQGVDHTPVTSVHIDDPVAGTRIDWSSQRKKVTIVKLPGEDQRHGCWRSEVGRLTINYPPDKSRIAPAESDSGGKASSLAAGASPQLKRPKPVLEDLGETTIQGVEARGQRRTTTTPAGAIGNDQPLVRTSET